MLIKLSETENVILPRPRFGTRAIFAVPVQAAASVQAASVQAASVQAAASVRAVPVQAASVHGGPSAILRASSARPSTDLPSAAAQGQPCAHALTGGPAANYMTRISATGEGASGPHPAREPEPV